MLYESKVISIENWKEKKDKFIGWEFKTIAGTVYLRKHISGKTSLDIGWLDVK